MTTSGTYLFGTNTKLDDLIRESYERIGIISNEQTGLQVQSAIFSGNLELAAWPGMGLNLWLIQQQMFQINPSQPTYQLPDNTVRILEVVYSTPQRLTDAFPGTVFSSATASGAATNCFNSLNSTGWTSSDNDGAYIGFNWVTTTAPSVAYVGITPLSQTGLSNYTLALEYATGPSVNPASAYWQTIYTVQNTNFKPNETLWFVIQNKLNCNAFRIRKIGGTDTNLSLQQVYFSQPPFTGFQTGDRFLGPLSRSEWITIANKMQGAYNNYTQPSGFYYNQTIPQTLTLWPVTGVAGSVILYTSYHYAQDMTYLFQQVDVPARFYDALCAGLAVRLAEKFQDKVSSEKFQSLQARAQQAYALAKLTDFENVPFRMIPDYTGYGVAQ